MVLLSAENDKPLNYAIPALTESKLDTLYPPFERRTWRLLEESRLHRQTILVYLNKKDGKWTAYLTAVALFKDVRIVSLSPFVIRLDPDGKTVLDVARALDIRVRKF